MPILITQRFLLRTGVFLMTIALGAAIVWWFWRGDEVQHKQDVRSAQALAETAQDAAATVIARAEHDASVDELVTEAVKEIDNAPSDEAAGDAARAAICGLPDYRLDPACALQ